MGEGGAAVVRAPGQPSVFDDVGVGWREGGLTKAPFGSGLCSEGRSRVVRLC